MARMVFIAPVRASDDPSPAVTGTFHSILTAANSNSVPVTFPVRYDALVDSGYHTDLLTLAGAGHEAAAWLEITPGLCTAAGVTINPNGTTTFAACRCLLLGYSQADRRALIDTQFAAHHALFGAYPATIHAWMIDSYSAAYCRDTYGVTLASLCRDQWATDAYELQGGPQNTIWEAHPDWLMAPCTPTRRGNLAVIRGISVDLLRNYGNGAGSGVVNTLEPVAAAVDGVSIAAYWTPLAADQLTHPPVSPFGPVVAAFMEDAYSWSSYGSYTSAALAQMHTFAGAGTATLTTCAQLAADFLASSYAVRDAPRYLRQTVDPYASGGSVERCMEVTYAAYKARLRLHESATAGAVYLSDLRTYEGVVDPYGSTVCNTQVGTWRVPPVLDAGNYSASAARALQDYPGASPLSCHIASQDPPSAVVSDAGGAGNITIPAIPEAAGYGLFWTREAGTSTASVECLPRGIIWQAARTAAGSSSLLYLDYGIEAVDDPLTEYISVSGTESSVHATSNSATLTAVTGVDYLVLVFDNRDAAVLLFPLRQSGGAWYGATATGQGVRLGVQASGAGAVSCTVAVIPTSKTYWRAALAALQHDVWGYLRGV